MNQHLLEISLALATTVQTLRGHKVIRCNAELFKIASMGISTDLSRPSLHGVFVEPSAAGGVIMTATNGHQIICVYDKDGFADEVAVIKLSPGALKECKPVSRNYAKVSHSTRFILLDGVDATVFDGTTDGEKFAAVAISPKCLIGEGYPDFRHVIFHATNKLSGDSTPGYFDGKYMVFFGDIAIALAKTRGYRVAPLRILPANGPLAPALVVFGGDDRAFGVLMPMRVGAEPEAVPRWFDRCPSVDNT